MKNLYKRLRSLTSKFYWLSIFLFFLYYPEPTSAQGLIIDCATNDAGEGYCSNINAFLRQAIRIGEYLLGIAGSLALLAFMYGGIMMMVSFGNQERFKKGRKALVAATVGLLIAFGAYIIIGFVLDALGVQSSFRGII